MAKRSVDDHFSKLHPNFPVDTSIAILGGGPSGLSAAYALSRLGYNNVTVLEKYHMVSGMCESVDIEGKIYDLGGQVLAGNSSPAIFHLAKETGSELEDMDSHKLALIDSSTGKYQDMQVADEYTSLISLTLDLQEKASNLGRIGVHAMSDLAADIAPEFLESNKIASLPKSVVCGYTASGYGFIEDMPYAYIHEFIKTSMAGKIRRFKGGYGNMWKRLSDSLPVKVLCNTEVLKVKRDTFGVKIDVRDSNRETQTMDFDKILISGAFPFRTGKTYRSPCLQLEDCEENRILDESNIEKELFSKVQIIDYYTTVLKIKGLEHMPIGFYYFEDFIYNPSTIGNPVAMQKFYADTDVFLFWSYGDSAHINADAVTKLAIDAATRIGGEVETVVLKRRFKYFPHVRSEDMKDGFYEKLEEEVQGKNNTFYVGGLMAFELTERNSSYSMALVRKHFANDHPLPKYPYVKRLLPLRSHWHNGLPNKWGETVELDFPDLSSLDAYLEHWGTHETTANKILYTWLNEDGEVGIRRTYKELHTNASCIAQKLLKNQKPSLMPGDRVLLVYVPGLDFIDAFFGCIRARLLPVPVIPPDPLQRGGQALLKIENISKSCNAVAILSTVGYHTAVRAGFVKSLISLSNKNQNTSGRWPDIPWLHTDTWIRNSKASHLDHVEFNLEPLAKDICFLQFTSGSTGDAKGVMITHGGLIHNVKLMRKIYRSTSNTVLVSWLPQYHDMGLIGGLFTALVSGGTAVLFSPMTFIKNPLMWIDTISKYKGTHSAGPNFAFELVVRRMELHKDSVCNFDLSSLIFLMVGAEPVRHQTLRRFIDLTAPLGLSESVIAPGYGLAENCVFVNCGYGEGKPILVDWQGRVCCGYPSNNNEDIDIRIVDQETGEEHKDSGKEGEIWISSPSAGVGYWGKEELSQKTFQNSLTDLPGKVYTRTGDLGRVIDGNLFITGRIKDLVIVGGRNIYSADIEKTVENSSELLRPGCCAVIGVPEETLISKGISVPEFSEQIGLVAIAEVKDGKAPSRDVVEQIQARVAEEHGISLASIKFIRPKTISKTTSGKIKRYDCLKQFSDGTLNLVPEPIMKRRTLLRSFTTGSCREGNTPRNNVNRIEPLPNRKEESSNDIVEFLRKLVSEITEISIDKISTTESLVSYGIDSIGVVRAAQKLSDFLGVPVGAVDIFSATCIDDLASFSKNLVLKSKPGNSSTPSQAEFESTHLEVDNRSSIFRKLVLLASQVLGLTYATGLLILPSYMLVSLFFNLILSCQTIHGAVPWATYLISLSVAPLVWMVCIFATCISIGILGNSFLQPNYALTPEISVWSLDFVKWWTLYKAQEISSKVLAVHLRGTVFLSYWFQLLGAKIGSSVLLDTIDITDPALVSIGDGVVIAEGALIQSHEVRNGVLSFLPIKIGRNSSIGPYSVVLKGSTVREGGELPALQKADAFIPGSRLGISRTIHKLTECFIDKFSIQDPGNQAINHLCGIYMIGLLSTLSAALCYCLYIWLSQSYLSVEHFSFLCIAGAFHWLPFSMMVLATMTTTAMSNPMTFAIGVASAYLAHGVMLIFLTSIMNTILSRDQESEQGQQRAWLRHRLSIACHLRFAKLLSGTEAFCIYLRLLGAKVGKYCSIRAINPIFDPSLLSLGNGVHLGDFSRIITGFYSHGCFNSGNVEVHDNSVIGSQSLVLPGAVVQDDVVLGALSIAPANSVLRSGGIYVGSENPLMIKNKNQFLDERIDMMDKTYKKIVGNLAANLAATTLKVKTRYFHRIGVSGKGVLKIYDDIEGFPDHKIFCPGKSYQVIVRHSNSLSADDDARIDARGAAVRILSDDTKDATSLLDLTLKTGNSFYARTISDFATWLVCGLPAREQHVKRMPHIRDAVWTSLRNADSYADMHYYSNISRLFRFTNGQEMYVKFKLRPSDQTISEESGKVEPTSILPPETGAIPRDSNDMRPLLFLADEFEKRVSSPNGVHYIFQLQIRPVPNDEAEKDIALDCTKPWDENKFPLIDVGEIRLDHNLSREASEQLEFNPFLRSPEVDIIPATSASQSASIDHGRSLVYEICQYLRNGKPLPEAWRMFIEQSDVKVDLSGCPIASVSSMKKKDLSEVTLARTKSQTAWSILAQPLLQTFLPYFLLAYVIYSPMNWLLRAKETMKYPLHFLLPIFWISSGLLAALACVFLKWILVGKKKDGGTVKIWSKAVLLDTIWQAFRTVVGEYFMEMTSGSSLFVLWMKLMGSNVDFGVYVDSMGALLNPEMVEIENGGSVGREALLFGHIYEGEGGNVKFGKITVEEGGFVGSRAVVMPGVVVECDGNLSSLSLAMKEEIIKSK
ncbi:hypothetical protein LIER_04625 [Lithospermum erythrorhizon]|uniref:Carrier domain-containing protein n=1 Tax=Lithospermum erythrorhizon TaxID=34254 RepID=A0AAV3NXU6_LITER